MILLFSTQIQQRVEFKNDIEKLQLIPTDDVSEDGVSKFGLHPNHVIFFVETNSYYRGGCLNTYVPSDLVAYDGTFELLMDYNLFRFVFKVLC